MTNSGAALFAIDSSSAELSLRQGLDYEALPTGDKTYEITVVATDGGNLKVGRPGNVRPRVCCIHCGALGHSRSLNIVNFVVVVVVVVKTRRKAHGNG